MHSGPTPVSRTSRFLHSLGAAGIALVLATCTQDVSAPSGPGTGVLRLQPTFSSGTNLAAINLAVDRIQITVVRPPQETVVDTTVPFSLDSAAVRVALRIPLRAQAETLQATLRMFAGTQLLFSGTITVVVRAGDAGTNQPPQIPLTYVGPGAQVTTLRITPRDSFLTLGGSLQLQLLAQDAQGTPVPVFYASWRSSGAPVVNAQGLVQAPATRGQVTIVARTPTGVQDQTTLNFVPAPSALAIVSGNNQTGPVGSALQPLVVEVRGSDNLGVGGVPVSFRTLTGGGAVRDPVVITNAQGQAATIATLGTPLGLQSFEASVTGLAPVVFSATGVAGAAARIAANSAITQSGTAGAPVPVAPSVLVTDALSNPVSGVGVDFVVTLGGGSVSPTPPIQTNASGVATLGSWTLGPAVGPNTVEARVSGLIGSPVIFSASGLAGGAGRLAIATPPSTAVQSGVVFPQQPTIQLQDASGNPVAQAGVPVTAAIATGGGTLGGTLTVNTNTAGLAVFTNLAISGLVGPRTLIFSSSGLSDATSGTITVSAGPAARLGVAVQPSSSASSSVPFAQQPQVQLEDASGNPVSTAGVSVLASIATGGGTLGGNPTAVTNTAGRATYTDLSITGAVGNRTLGFASPPLAGATSGTIAVGPGPATQIAANSAVSQSATVATNVSQPPTVVVRDGQSNPVAGVSVTFTLTQGGGAIVPISPAVVSTNASGIAALTSWTIGPTVGTNNNTVVATATGLTGSPVTFNASGTAGVASKLGLTTQPSPTGQAGVALSTQPVAQIQDANGNPVAQAGVLVTATIQSGPSGTLANATATTAASGAATFSGLAITGPTGSYTLQFAAGILTPAVSNAITLGTGPTSPTTSTVTALPTTIAADGVASSTITVTARDAGGNPVANKTVTLGQTGGGVNITQPAAQTNASGVTTGSITATTPGDKVISATVTDGGPVAITQTATVTATLAGPTQLLFRGDSAGQAPPRGIHRANADGTGRVNVTTEGNSFDDVNPRWSPDGQRVTYSARAQGGDPLQLHVTDAVGSQIAHLTSITDTSTRRPKYSPDGKHLAFECGDGFSQDQDVCVVSNVDGPIGGLDGIADGAGKRFLGDVIDSRLTGSGAFAWDRLTIGRIAMVRDSLLSRTVSQIYTMNFDGTSVTPLAPILVLGADSLQVLELTWSPNGAFLVFSAINSTTNDQQLYRINRDGTGLKELTKPAGFDEDSHPTISPDNSQVVFVRDDFQVEGSNLNYFIVPADGDESGVQQLTGESGFFVGRSDATPDWSPDGANIVIVGSAGGGQGIYTIKPTTRAQTYLSERVLVSNLDRNDGQPSWRP